MANNSKFNQLFNEKIKPILRNYEVYRKKEYKKHITSVYVISFIMLFCVLGVVLPFFNYDIMDKIFCNTWIMTLQVIGLPLICISAPALYVNYIKKQNKKFQITLKTDCLAKVLNIFGDMKWKNDFPKDKAVKINWISDDSLEKSGLFIPFNTRNTDDEFKGTWHGVNYTMSETQLIDVQNRQCIEAFKGIVIRFKCNKNIKNRTIVATKGNMTQKDTVMISTLMAAVACLNFFIRDGFSWFSVISTATVVLLTFFASKSMMKKKEKLEEVTLEDTKFNERFDVYSSDQVEARYLVTPAFMERLYNLQTTFRAEVIKCSFYEGYLMVAISTKKDLFELGDLFHPLLNADSHIKSFKDLYSILKLIQLFKLDEKVGL